VPALGHPPTAVVAAPVRHAKRGSNCSSACSTALATVLLHPREGHGAAATVGLHGGEVGVAEWMRRENAILAQVLAGPACRCSPGACGNRACRPAGVRPVLFIFFFGVPGPWPRYDRRVDPTEGFTTRSKEGRE